MKFLQVVARVLVALIVLLSARAHAEDIDIFTGNNRIAFDLPSVIFVLDNTSNWSREAQQWPGGLTQGQSEVRAIARALESQVGKLNVGLMEYSTAGSGNENDGAYIRFDLQALTETSKDELDTILETIFNDIGGNLEKRSSSNAYGYLPYDLYNYLAGTFQSKGGAGTPSSLADPDGYETQFGKFQSPLDLLDSCGDVYVIFVGNNAQGSITTDDSTNSAALKALYEAVGEEAPDALYGDSGTPLSMPEFTSTTVFEPGEVQGNSASCWKETELEQCTAQENSPGGLCAGKENCSCTVKAANQAGCQGSGKPSTRTYRYQVATDGVNTTLVEASGLYDTSGGLDFNFDDWTKFLYNWGVPIPLGIDEADLDPEILELLDEWIPDRVNVITYTIDVFNRQQEADLSELWFSAAEVGGGRYFQAKTESQILSAINEIISDILSVSTSFAAVSMPLSATNRARVENQVYIGMFRPAQGKEPRWYGNLKRYQLALFNGQPQLADVNYRRAINPLTGFAGECAESFWTTETGTYWENLGVDPPTRSECSDAGVNHWSDLPDGPFVEKGGVAQQLRETASGGARTLYTVSSDESLRALTSSDALLMGGEAVYNYLIGDTEGVGEIMPGTGLRSSVHGDVIHSRPLSVRYNSDKVLIYYGSNGGTYRAIDPADGSEVWGLVTPEHFGRLQRLHDNTPLIKYTGIQEDPLYTYEPKGYFFDGSTGNVVMYDSEGIAQLAYIYPTMRRGGRMIYGLDVTNPEATPSLMWRKGCPSQGSDEGCSVGFESIGQTWSMPVGGYADGYIDDAGDAKLVATFGGGYDECLDADQAAYPVNCSTAKGRAVYVVDAVTGELLRKFSTEAPVVAELSLVDIDFSGSVDFAYAADAAGNIYRVNFATLADENPENNVSELSVDEWTMHKIGSMDVSGGRRFMNAPVVAPFQRTVIVTIGSGDRERPLDINYPFTEQVQNRFYALIDKPFLTFVSDTGADLQEDEVTTVNLDGDSMLAVTSGLADNSLTGKDGWYMNLSDRGEQVVNPSVVGGGKVFFNTFRPGGVELGICRQPLGIGTGYEVQLFSPDFTVGEEITTPGIPIPPVIATVKIPPGIANCVGDECSVPEGDPCVGGECEVRTLCIGCQGFDPVEIEPVAPPTRRRVYFSEDIDEIQ